MIFMIMIILSFIFTFFACVYAWFLCFSCHLSSVASTCTEICCMPQDWFWEIICYLHVFMYFTIIFRKFVCFSSKCMDICIVFMYFTIVFRNFTFFSVIIWIFVIFFEWNIGFICHIMKYLNFFYILFNVFYCSFKKIYMLST